MKRIPIALGAAAVHAPEQVGLAGADRARARPAQGFQRIVGFVAVVPDDDEEIPDYLI